MNTLRNEANQKIRPKSRIEQLLYFLLIFLMEKDTFEDICGYFSLFWVILLVVFLGRFGFLLKMKKVKFLSNWSVLCHPNTLYDSFLSVFGRKISSFKAVCLFWFRLPPATKAPRGRPSPRRRAEENGKKEAETGGSGYGQFNRTANRGKQQQQRYR